jgi:hypothetical protein
LLTGAANHAAGLCIAVLHLLPLRTECASTGAISATKIAAATIYPCISRSLPRWAILEKMQQLVYQRAIYAPIWLLGFLNGRAAGRRIRHYISIWLWGFLASERSAAFLVAHRLENSRLISLAGKGSASHLFSWQLVILDAGRDVALTGI